MELTFHGTDDQIEAYVLGRLPDCELAAVEEHLLICSTCQDRLKETEVFSIAIKEALASDPAPRSPAWAAWLRRPGVSVTVGLVALIALISVFSARRTQFAPVSVLKLSANRGEMPVAAPAREWDLTLSDSPPNGGVFRVEIVNAMGQTVWSGLAQSTASGVEVKAQRLLPPGDYFVRQYALSGKVRREYGFRIRQ